MYCESQNESIMKNSYLIICFLLLSVQSALGEHITKSVHFSHSELKCDTLIGEDGEIYIKMSYPETGTEANLGFPMLPVKYVTISLPFAADDISLIFHRSNTNSYFLDKKLFPVQEPEVDSWGKRKSDFISCNNNVYNLSSCFPSVQAKIVEVSCSGQGDRRVVVAVYPAVYFPSKNQYDFSEDIVISISYKYSPQRTRSLACGIQTLDIGIPFYEYCVITSQNLKDAFTRLVSWKREKGLNAGVVCKEDILNNHNIFGDTVSDIYDDAGKIRQYFQYAYASGVTKYVLLGGNYKVLPIRYGTSSHYNDNTPVYPTNNIPTDLYFSELNSDWDYDRDIHYGEPYDSCMDYGSELAVGRLLCENTEEIKNFTDKLLWYEINPGNGDFSYLTKALYMQSDENQDLHYGDSIMASLHDIFPNDTLISEVPSCSAINPESPTGNEVITEMNKRYGFVSWLCHGHPNAVITKSDSLNISSHYGIFSVQEHIPFMVYESANGLDNLTNKYYPMIVYTKACTTTPFDIYTEYSGWSYDQYPNLGQSFTMGKAYGGPAFIGNTRDGLRTPAYKLQRLFNQYVRNYRIGEAQNQSKMSYTGNEKHYITLSSNLIGCPELRIWTSIPTLFQATLSYNFNNYVVSANNSIAEAEIGLRDITKTDEAINTVSFNPSQGPQSLADVENNLITLTGKNCIPQILPLTIQNTNLQGTHYAFVKDVSCGKDVRVGTQGNVIFKANSDYTFESKGTFKLAKGVKIEKGAKLRVVPSEINY